MKGKKPISNRTTFVYFNFQKNNNTIKAKASNHGRNEATSKDCKIVEKINLNQMSFYSAPDKSKRQPIDEYTIEDQKVQNFFSSS